MSKAAVLELAPELADNGVLTIVVALTCKIIEQAFDIWGDLADEGHRTLAAHFAAILQTPGASGQTGAVASKTIDKLSVSYVNGQFEDAELGATKYGRLHLALLHSIRGHRAASEYTEPPDWDIADRRIV